MGRILAGFALLAAAPTQVVTFAPAMPPPGSKQVEGSCWTNSIAVDRKGAWRCMAGNEIHDPCFSTSRAHEVVCDANPARHEPGFLLKLTQPLPAEVKHGAPSPWIIQLDDGTICQATTGTLPPVSGDPARWACDTHDPKAQSFLSSIKPGEVWTAQRFELAPDPKHAEGFVRKNVRRVSIHALWQ